MGHAILYCTVCQTQLRATDFESGAAVKAEMSVYCAACLPEGVTPDRPKAPIKVGTPSTRRSGTTSTRIPLPGKTPPPPTRRRTGTTSARIQVVPDSPPPTSTRRALAPPRWLQ